jgi:uncharacterized protein YcfL
MKYPIIILILFTAIVAISGCTSKTASNGTFGEKVISLDTILVSNNTTAEQSSFNGTEFYYIKGYLINNNSYDAFHIKINATAYNANGDVVATNNSAYMVSNNIPAKGESLFYVQFNDPNNTITRYDVKIVDATGTL